MVSCQQNVKVRRKSAHCSVFVQLIVSMLSEVMLIGGNRLGATVKVKGGVPFLGFTSMSVH